MADWLDDLEEFPSSMVAEACKEWRRTETRRPTIAGIRALCIALSQKRRIEPKLLPSYDPELAEKARAERQRQYAEAAAAREEWARSCGCTSFAEAMQIGLAYVAKRAERGAA